MLFLLLMCVGVWAPFLCRVWPAPALRLQCLHSMAITEIHLFVGRMPCCCPPRRSRERWSRTLTELYVPSRAHDCRVRERSSPSRLCFAAIHRRNNSEATNAMEFKRLVQKSVKLLQEILPWSHEVKGHNEQRQAVNR